MLHDTAKTCFGVGGGRAMAAWGDAAGSAATDRLASLRLPMGTRPSPRARGEYLGDFLDDGLRPSTRRLNWASLRWGSSAAGWKSPRIGCRAQRRLARSAVVLVLTGLPAHAPGTGHSAAAASTNVLKLTQAIAQFAEVALLDEIMD